MIYVLIGILLIFYFSFSKYSISRILTLLYLFSLLANFFIGTYSLNEGLLLQLFYVLWVGLVLFLIISPWNKYKIINSIDNVDYKKLLLFVKIVGTICIFMTVGCFILGHAIHNVVEDIDGFKYRGGQEEILGALNISTKPYLLAYALYPLSYFFIPLIFYYISKKKYALSVWCFISSLTSVAFGYAYFSRSHTTHYVLLVISTYWLYRGLFPYKIRKRIVYLGLSLISVSIISFMAISFARFEDHGYAFKKNDALIQNPVAYSLMDYYGMWWYEGAAVTSDYSFSNFNGQLSLQSVSKFINITSFGTISLNDGELQRKREALLKEHYGTFIGVSSYFLYDFGIFISLIILLIYYNLTKRRSPIHNKISLSNAMQIVILIQLPLFGIFYSTLDVIILMYVYWAIIRFCFKKNSI